MKNFLAIAEDKRLFMSSHFFIIKDSYPVSPGHLLIISNELIVDYFGLSVEAKQELPNLIDEAKRLIETERSPDGYNIGMNCGKPAGQTIFHFHCHIIPRYKGDMDDPRGGVRHCLEGKGYY